MAGLLLTGSASDDSSGVDRVTIVYTHAVTGARVEVEASLSCDASRLTCMFSADGPGAGVWAATARAKDRSGNVESPGPTMSGLIAIP
jgi:hypothetical protein